MTKSVRVENADTLSYKVKVQVQDKDAGGEWADTGSPVTLGFPTAIDTFGITSSRRLIIEELP